MRMRAEAGKRNVECSLGCCARYQPPDAISLRCRSPPRCCSSFSFSFAFGFAATEVSSLRFFDSWGFAFEVDTSSHFAELHISSPDFFATPRCRISSLFFSLSAAAIAEIFDALLFVIVFAIFRHISSSSDYFRFISLFLLIFTLHRFLSAQTYYRFPSLHISHWHTSDWVFRR